MVGDNMLGKIIGIEDNVVLLKLNVKLEEMQNIINLYVLFEDSHRKLIGEIVDIKLDTAYINLLGEFNNDNFTFGISKKPSFSATTKLISKDKVNFILALNKELQQKKITFLNRLKDNFELDRISNKVDAFYNFDFKTLLSELKKRKVMLSLIQQDEWEEYFMAYKTEINALQAQINQTDNEIDQLVYELYGLTQDEIKIVEEASV